MNLIFKPVSRKLPEYRSIKQLYRTAFPKNEQAPFWMLMRKTKRDGVDFYGIYDSEKWIALLYTITYKDITYIFYLAVSDTARGGGYGSEILKAVKEKYRGNRIALSIETLDEEAPNYRQRVKRKEFYARNGLESLGYTVTEFGVPYEILGCGGAVSETEYIDLFRDFFGKFIIKIAYR